MLKNFVLALIVACSLYLLANASAGLAQQRVITLPLTDGAVSADPRVSRFAYDGQIGINLAADRIRGALSLFVFSVRNGVVTDQYDLESDFGFVGLNRRALLKAHDSTGLILVYGTDDSGNQKFVAFRSDKSGRLSRLWNLSYPPSEISISDDVAFSGDGSIVYLIYNKTVPVNETNIVNPRLLDIERPPSTEPTPVTVGHNTLESRFHPLDGINPVRAFATVVMVGADDGTLLATRELPDGGNFSAVWCDSAGQRLIAVAGSTIFLIEPKTGDLAIQGSLASPPGPKISIGISSDGRFLLVYFGPDSTGNSFWSYNLDLGTSSMVRITEPFAPYADNFVFHGASGVLLVPLAIPLSSDAQRSGSRTVNIVMLKSDGSIVHQADAVIPKRSNGELNVIHENNTAISASGAVGFVSASSNRVFAFDTLTGDVVNELEIPAARQNFIQVLDPPGLLVSTNGATAIILTPLSVGPEITGMMVTKKQTIIQGATFLSGTRVTIDGVSVDSAQRNPENPGHEIVLPFGKAHFPKGQQFSIVVTNRDGLSSASFSFTR